MHESVLRINKLQLFLYFFLLELSSLPSRMEGPDLLPLVHFALLQLLRKGWGDDKIGSAAHTVFSFTCHHTNMCYMK